MQASVRRIALDLNQIKQRQALLMEALEENNRNLEQTGPESPLGNVRATMCQLPGYQDKARDITRTMITIYTRMKKLQKRVARLRAAVPATTAYRESGKFAYRVCYRGGIAVRSEANVDSTLTGSVIRWNQVFWGVERYAPVGSDMIFVRLEEPVGWVFETKNQLEILERITELRARRLLGNRDTRRDA